ncbi:MAG: hypothetical protein NTZ48_00410, partial [Candidatus Omnitrophica bacterium]|nr:hypothetical protein [Candidatus Omnitrophota bacterium]
AVLDVSNGSKLGLTYGAKEGLSLGVQGSGGEASFSSEGFSFRTGYGATGLSATNIGGDNPSLGFSTAILGTTNLQFSVFYGGLQLGFGNNRSRISFKFTPNGIITSTSYRINGYLVGFTFGPDGRCRLSIVPEQNQNP